MMKPTKWTGSGRTLAWFNAQNWSDGIPAGGQSVDFTDGQTWTIGLGGRSAAAGAIDIAGDRIGFTAGTLTAMAAQPSSGAAADLSIDGGSLALAASATLVTPDAIVVGATAAGTLSVHGTLTGAIVDLDEGAISVSGAAAHLTIAAGGQAIDVGDGAFTVANGGTVDAGADTLQVFYSNLVIGGSAGSGTVTVTGPGSSLTLGIVTVGNGDNGIVDVTNGGSLHAGVLYAGMRGDGLVDVSGAGSVLSAVNGVDIGDADLLPAGSMLTITRGGAVQGGVRLSYGLLKLDASASVSGEIDSQVGRIEALASKSAGDTVTLGNTLYLLSNNGTQGQFDHDTTLFAQPGATLDVTGAIGGEADAILSIGSGHVILANSGDTYGATALFNAHLEIAATGAAGGGTLSFTGGTGQAPILQIDAGVAFKDTIAGFAGHDAIDLRGFAFGGGVTDSFANGALTLRNGGDTVTLSLAGSYTVDSFVLLGDHHGGTLVRVGQG